MTIDAKKDQAKSNMSLFQEGCLARKRVLDVGCDIGANVYFMRKAGANVLGVEPNKKAFDEGCHLGFLNTDYDLNCAVQDLPEGFNSSFDIITIFLYSIDCKSREEVFLRIKTLLKPDGLLIIGTEYYGFIDLHNRACIKPALNNHLIWCKTSGAPSNNAQKYFLFYNKDGHSISNTIVYYPLTIDIAPSQENYMHTKKPAPTFKGLSSTFWSLEKDKGKGPKVNLPPHLIELKKDILAAIKSGETLDGDDGVLISPLKKHLVRSRANRP